MKIITNKHTKVTQVRVIFRQSHGQTIGDISLYELKNISLILFWNDEYKHISFQAYTRIRKYIPFNAKQSQTNNGNNDFI